MEQTEKPWTILIVEDEIFLGDLISSKFADEKVGLLRATDGDSAIKIAAKEHPDVILLDLILPNVSGFDVLKNFKTSEVTKNIPVIILSNLGQQADIDRCMELGAADFLIKAHVSPAEIIAKVKEVMSQKQ